MDLDGFKEVNDSLGHEVGDALLAEVAERLAECVREDDTVARLGGDEFTVILTGTKQRKDVERVVRTIIDSLVVPFQIAEQPVRISVSIGVSFYPGMHPLLSLCCKPRIRPCIRPCIRPRNPVPTSCVLRYIR